MMLTIVIIAALAVNLVEPNPVANNSRYLWQDSGKYQGDMILRPDQRNGLIDVKYRWPNAIIPYEISDVFTLSDQEYIHGVLQGQFSKTCVTVRPRTTETDYVYVSALHTGCWSYVGRLGGRQDLNLHIGGGCVWYSTIVHEFLHAAGFWHQQSATERDDYVEIFYENIDSDQWHNFEKYDANTITSFGEEYDYYSVMHYTRYAFSNNGLPTILAKADPSIPLGEVVEMSAADIRKLDAMYGCV